LARRRRFSDEVGLWWPATVLRCGGGRGRELDAPRMKNGERRARVTLTVDESRDSGDSRTSTSFGHGRRRGFGQRRRRGRDGARRGSSDSRSERGRSERRGAVKTLARSPDSAFNVRARRVAATWQWCAARWARRGQRRLTGGTHFWTLGTNVSPAPNFMQICTLVDYVNRNNFSFESGD
jgi:hypothetical protein